jgi:hypothetical protein
MIGGSRTSCERSVRHTGGTDMAYHHVRSRLRVAGWLRPKSTHATVTADAITAASSTDIDAEARAKLAAKAKRGGYRFSGAKACASRHGMGWSRRSIFIPPR